MRQSKLFTKTIREAPKDEKSLNSQLLIRAGFVDKLMAGVYTFLPLGLRVLKKIENIIREEINAIGGQEVLMPALHPKENWQKTGRWQILDVLFKLTGRDGREYALGATHEEILAPLVKKFIFSYQDLPLAIYQIQDKFRDELRVKSGLLRGREFIMKDLYSFHKNEKDLDEYYEKAKRAYFKIFKRCHLEKQTFLTLASGGTFSKYSHEFQAAASAGEDTVYVCQKCHLAINYEIKSQIKECPACGSRKFMEEKTIEVGNIFKLGTKYSAPFRLTFKDKDGHQKPVLMGCYGIGLGRLMGAVVEVGHDEKGIIWPREVSPFDIHLIQVGRPLKFSGGQKVKKAAEKIYQNLQKNKIEVLYDDRDNKTPGEKFADCDLIGIPIRIVVSEKTLKKSCVEIKRRKEEKIKLVKTNRLLQFFKIKNQKSKIKNI